MVLLVALRMGLGCHFLYEGVWKITHPKFSAEGFLLQAKGPAAGLFHAMVHDIDGRQRLKIERTASADRLVDAWRKVRNDSQTRYRAYVTKPYKAKLKKNEKLSADDEAAIQQTVEKFRKATQPILWKAEDDLDASLKETEQAILAYFGPRDEEQPAAEREELAEGIKTWLSAVADIEREYLEALQDFAKNAKNAKNAKDAVARSVGPLKKKPLAARGEAVEMRVKGNRIMSPQGREIVRVEDAIKAKQYVDAFNRLKLVAIQKYELADEQEYQAERLYRRYRQAVKDYLAESRQDIAVYFAALDRFGQRKSGGNNGAAHQKKRLYDQQQKLRKEVKVWLDELDGASQGCQAALWNVLDDRQKAEGSLPLPTTEMDAINFMVKFALTAIGLCLILGLFTRPAALGGAMFMLFMILMQPGWPTIYPPAPPAAGHSLLINKDFIEMLAMLLVMVTASGRWCGLDYFVEQYIVRLYGSLKGKSKKQE